MLPKLIAVIGPIGAGKTTAAALTARRWGYEPVSFATPLKQMIKALGLTDEDLSPAKKEKPHALLAGKSPREAMQFLGDEWGRQKIGPNFWVDLWKSRVTAVRGLVVVDDARYPNEFTAIREMGGFIVHVDRPTAKTKFANHASEMFHAEAGADISICNDGNMQDLQDDLIAMMANLQRKERDNATPRTNATA